ncbi:MAG TPA: TonB-dependent receptor [Gammaproteobacteria bacterium]|nr:TonB-dependent receptor [Gammaproteobacteria bacterium]
MLRKPRSCTSSIHPVAAAVALAVGSGCIAAPALAQQAEGTAPAALDEIVVTASRRPTTVHDTPFNVQAYTGGLLEQQRITDLTELSRWVPGLTVVDQGPRASDLMTVRGLNVGTLDASEFLDNSSGGTVQTYLGDIPVYLDLKPLDIDRVEVLLGPQGTLYGASTLGGAVRYIPNAPDTERFTVDAKGDLYSLAHSNGTGYETDFTLNVPLVRDKLAFRASAMRLGDPGFIDYPYLVRDPGVSNPQPDFNNPADVAANLKRVDDADWEHTLSSRLSLLWQVSDRLSATFDYYHQDQDVGARTITNRESFGTGQYESGQRFLEPDDRRTDLLSADVVADLGFAKLTSATGVSQFDGVGQRDQTDLLLDMQYGYEQFPEFAAYTHEVAHERRFNEEVRLVSTGTGPWGWIGGLFYNDYTSHASSEEFTPGIPQFFGISPPTGDLEYRQLTDAELKERALFGEVSYAFTQQWDLTLGGRFFRYRTDQTVSYETPLISDTASVNPAAADDDGFLGKINLAYRVSPKTLAYANISQGYRIGGVNTVPVCAADSSTQPVCATPDQILIKPDRTTNYELGVHTGWREGRLKLNADVYDIDWQDIQTLARTDVGDAFITVNGGSARSRGLELSLQAATDGPWSFTASYAYDQAELTSFAKGLVDGEDAYAGDRLAGTPEEQGSFSASYSRPLANGMSLKATYGLTATSSVLTQVGLRDNGEMLGGYAVHSASVGISRNEWTACLFADNLTDKYAETGVRSNSSDVGDIAGFTLRRYFHYVLRPRTVGVEFHYRLGE